jgi:transcriptional regulator with XRE-family HTH domain
MTTLAEKIDFLFRTILRPDGKEFTYQEVESGTNRAVTGPYIWKLRAGSATNPGFRALSALSSFFQVPATFFFEDEPTDDYLQDLQLAAQLRDNGIAQIALRAQALGPEGRAAVLQMIDYVSKAQKTENSDGRSQKITA